jgi:hypothetical protein
MCKKCQLNKSILFFYKDKSRSDGLEYICKNCAQIKKCNYKSSNYEELKEKALNYSRRPDIKLKTRTRKKNRLKSDIKYRVTENLRRRVSLALNGLNKSASTMKLLGCTIEEFKIYITNKFENKMSWNNYGIHGWHIDHIIPCSSFDLTDPAQQQICFHHTNLQPLWAIDNLKKSNKILSKG